METLERDYTPKGVQFYYVYKALAHPEYNNYITPFTLEERLMHVKEAQRTLGSRIPWITDAMTNDLKRALGDVPNGEFVIDPQGRVARRRAWSQPQDLRKDLEELVGPVESPTSVADLQMETVPPPPTIATGVVPGVKVSGRMRALKISPVFEEAAGKTAPFYVKLRAEADQGLLDTGRGQLYLGFHLDPLYEVHWNNLAPPLEFTVSSAEGVQASPAEGTAPKVDEPADSDPREFLVDVVAEDASEPIKLSVLYYACDNANTFCVPVTQRYSIHLEADRDGGSVLGRGMGPSGVGGRRGSARPAGGGDITQRLKRFDADGDGRLTRAELPDRMRRRFSRMDADGNGYVDDEELREIGRRMSRRR